MIAISESTFLARAAITAYKEQTKYLLKNISITNKGPFIAQTEEKYAHIALTVLTAVKYRVREPGFANFWDFCSISRRSKIFTARLFVSCHTMDFSGYNESIFGLRSRRHMLRVSLIKLPFAMIFCFANQFL